MSDNDVLFPGHFPDTVAESDASAPATSEHGVRWGHIWFLRSEAGTHAALGAKAENPSERQWHQRREVWCDQIASVLEKFAPPFPEDDDEPVRIVPFGDPHGNGFRIE